MNGTRKLILIFSAIIVICLCLTGCGKKDKNPVSVSNGGKVTTSPDMIGEDITYFLKPVVQREFFDLYLYVPDSYPIEITDFELWADDQRVGGRTNVDSKLRNLVISKANIEKMWIRLYNKSDVVADCEIDPSVESGELVIDLEH